jgi:ribosomal protein L37AE/L43A
MAETTADFPVETPTADETPAAMKSAKVVGTRSVYEPFLTFLRAAFRVSSEVVMYFVTTPEPGIRARPMDTQRASMMDQFFPATLFEEWHVSEEGVDWTFPEEFLQQLEAGLAVAKRWTGEKTRTGNKKYEKVWPADFTLELNDQTKQATLSIDRPEGGTLTSEIPLKSNDEPIPKEATLELDASVKITPELLDIILRTFTAVNLVEIAVWFRIDPDSKVWILKQQYDQFRHQLAIDYADEGVLEIKVDKLAIANYSREYLVQGPLTSFVKKKEDREHVANIEFQWATGKPLQVTIHLLQGWQTKWLLAPYEAHDDEICPMCSDWVTERTEAEETIIECPNCGILNPEDEYCPECRVVLTKRPNDIRAIWTCENCGVTYAKNDWNDLVIYQEPSEESLQEDQQEAPVEPTAPPTEATVAPVDDELYLDEQLERLFDFIHGAINRQRGHISLLVALPQETLPEPSDTTLPKAIELWLPEEEQVLQWLNLTTRQTPTISLHFLVNGQLHTALESIHKAELPSTDDHLAKLIQELLTTDFRGTAPGLLLILNTALRPTALEVAQQEARNARVPIVSVADTWLHRAFIREIIQQFPDRVGSASTIDILNQHEQAHHEAEILSP